MTAPAPTSGNVCVPPTGIHGDISDPSTTLLHADTQCEQCHNPARLVARPSFTDGWLNCVRPPNLPPRPQPVTPTADTETCTVKPGHVFTPPGTTCASCHNSVIARPLQQIPGSTPGKVCGQPPSTALPTIRTTATIASAVNDAGAVIASGASTPDTTPTLRGTLSAALAAGQTVSLLRNGAVVAGSAAVSGTSWTFTDPGGASGSQTYHARVVAGTAFGATGNGYTIVIDAAAPTAVANVTEVRDDVSGVVVTGSSTSDTTPTIVGAFSAAPGTGETVRIERNGVLLAGAPVTVSGATWRFTEPSALAPGTYSWQARVVDVAGNLGQPGTSQSATVVTNLASATITSAFNDAGAAIAAGATTSDTTPRLQGTINAALAAGQSVRVRRGAVVLEGSATVSGTGWTFTDPGSPQGSQSYTAFVQVGTVVGQPSAPYAIVVDSVAPTAAANVTEIRDSFLGIPVTGGTSSDSTPTVNGTLSGALAAGESVRLQRTAAGAAPVVVPGVTVSGGAWTFTEASPLAQATYSYQAQIVDAAGNLGALGTAQTVTISTTVRTAAITEIRNDAGQPIAPGGATTDTTPTLIGTLNSALAAGQTVRILRDGNLLAQPPVVSVNGTNWTYTDAGAPNGRHVYTARVDSGTVAGTPGTGYEITVDNAAPGQTIPAATFFALTDLKPWGNAVYCAAHADSAGADRRIHQRPDADDPLHAVGCLGGRRERRRDAFGRRRRGTGRHRDADQVAVPTACSSPNRPP